MKKLIATTLLASVFALGMGSQAAMAEGASAKAPTCKQQAKAKGLKKKDEIKAFVKECKAAKKKGAAK